MSETNKTATDLHYKPIGDTLILEELPNAEKIGAIYLPANQRKPSNQGIVIAKGELVPDNGAYDIGCLVIYPMYVDHTISLDRRDNLHVIRYTDVILSDYNYFSNQEKIKNEQSKKS